MFYVNYWFQHRNTISIPLTQRNENGKFDIPHNHNIDAPLVIGAFLFGVGWGLGGMCPGE